jgi:triphosphoribosyl-dephospho-CoA synthase
LCAQLAAAAQTPGALLSAAALRHAVQAVLNDLDVADARCTYRAIARAQPAGLGTAEQEDVHATPQVNLLQAMRLAADRDSVARQYAQGFSDVFDALGSMPMPALALALTFDAVTAAAAMPSPADAATSQAVQHLYLGFLARWPDSHIVRKHGPVTAQLVSAQARLWQSRLRPDPDPDFVAWDEQLKREGLNPGTSADLTVATLMLAGLGPAPGAAWHGS